MIEIELDKLYPLIKTDDYNKLYPIIRNIEDISKEIPSIYKNIMNFLLKNNQLDLLILKFINLIKSKPKEDLEIYQTYDLARFYLNIISQYEDSIVAFEMIQLLLNNDFPQISQIYEKFLNSSFKVPYRLNYFMGKILILLNINLEPIPLDYFDITYDFLEDFYQAILRGYYSKDFPSYIMNLTNFFHLFYILVELIFKDVDWWDKVQLSKYGGDFEVTHDCNIEHVLKHGIKITIDNGILTINYKDLFLGEDAEENKEVKKFNNIKPIFNLQYHKITSENTFEERWLIKHLESILSETDLIEWRNVLLNWKTTERENSEK